MSYATRTTEVVIYDADALDGPFSDVALRLVLVPDSGDECLNLRYGGTEIPVSVEELEVLAAAAKQLLHGEGGR
jgi:hypothetical protein